MNQELDVTAKKLTVQGEWGHCLQVAMEMCLRREKMATYTGNDFLDIPVVSHLAGASQFSKLT